MNIGDRVRVLHGTEEGIVIKIIDNKTVEIEIDQGFTFPVLISDLVKITNQEEQYFSEERSSEIVAPKKDLIADKGVFLALEIQDTKKMYRLYLINNTDLDIVCALFRKEGKLRYGGVFRGSVNSRKSALIKEFRTESLSIYNELYCQLLYFDVNPGSLRNPVERQIRMAGLLSLEKNSNAPVINCPAWVKQLDDHDELPMTDQETKPDKTQGIPPALVDLHAEVIGIQENELPQNEILSHQIQAFHKALDNALIYGLPEITFIHGIGQGTLKTSIIKELKKYKGIKYWEEAQKEKFGHGAIRIVL